MRKNAAQKIHSQQAEVILPVSFLEETQAARAAAAFLANFSNAGIHLLHVSEVFQSKIREEVQQKLVNRIALMKTESAFETVIEGSAPVQVKNFICENLENISYVTLSKRRRRFFDEFFFGSVANEVVQTCTKPVLVIPDDRKFENWKLRKIVVALSISGGAETALLQAMSLARYTNSELTFLHVVELDESIREQTPQLFSNKRENETYGVVIETFMTKYLEDLASKNDFPKNQLKTAVRFGSKIETIINFMEETQSDLLVTGSGSSSLSKSFLLGRIPSALCRTARFPLLIVRQQEEQDLKGAQ